LELGATPGGEIGVHAAMLDWGSSLPLNPSTRLNYGLGWSLFDFDRSGPMAVPDKLQKISLTLGASHRLNAQWLLLASVQPGLYGDLESGSRDAFNATGLFLANYARSRELVWSFGLRADPFADTAVIPIVGVNWRFAPDWEFTVGFPRVGFGYEASPALKLGFGLSAQGGSFHVGRDPRPVSIAVGPRLDDTRLDYREIRVGLSVDYKFSDVLSLAFEAGAITDQKFDYYEHGYTLDGGSTAFFTLGLTGRF
jgi:hypothetical protein